MSWVRLPEDALKQGPVAQLHRAADLKLLIKYISIASVV